MRVRLMHAVARDGGYSLRFITLDGSTLSITLDDAELRRLHSITASLMTQMERPAPADDSKLIQGAA